ncbi:MAG TPA: magnesium/cobalt transporter CorA [Thermoleophilaceae bacterium]|nr:magnesium/cobalt transporter CorA [Thermoleophilaceae bacterium]
MIVDCAIYEEGQRRDGRVDLEHAYDVRHEPGKFVWIGLYEPTEEEFASLRREFNLHELAVEDAIHAHQRPKLEVYEHMVFLVLKTARYVDPTEVIELGELLVFLGDDYIITVRHGEASSLTPVRESLEDDPEHLRRGPGAVLHAILDRVVDDYAPAIQGLETDIDEVEDELFSGQRTNPAERIYRLQREVLQFRKATAPLVEPMERLAEGRYSQIHPEIREYFRDVNDHLIRTRDQLDAMRDLLAGSLQANLAQVAVRQNDDVRRISAWVAIIAVPTAIAGIYGMNFEHMPELRWELGYPGVVFVMLAICSMLYRYFRRSGWL